MVPNGVGALEKAGGRQPYVKFHGQSRSLAFFALPGGLLNMTSAPVSKLMICYISWTCFDTGADTDSERYALFFCVGFCVG